MTIAFIEKIPEQEPVPSSVITVTGRSYGIASVTQQQLWFDERINVASTSSALFNFVFLLSIKQGSMSFERIRSAIVAVLDRDEILRPAVWLDEERGQLEQEVQLVIDNNKYSFLVTYNVQSREEINFLLAAESNIRFAQIDRGLIFRCHLLKLSRDDTEHSQVGDLIVFTIHQIAFDVNSVGLFLHSFIQACDLNEFYTDLTQYIDLAICEHVQLTDLTQYIDLAICEHVQLTDLTQYIDLAICEHVQLTDLTQYIDLAICEHVQLTDLTQYIDLAICEHVQLTDLTQYIDLAICEHVQLTDLKQDSQMNQARRFWSKLMSGYDWNKNWSFPNALATNIEARSGHSHSVTFTLHASLVNAQIQFALSNNISMFDLDLGSYVAFLYKLDNGERNDLCAVTPTDNRRMAETQSIIGRFVNLLPYRIKIEPDKSFIHLVQQIYHLRIAMLEHSQLPYQLIVSSENRNLSMPKVPFYFQFASHVSSLPYEATIEPRTKDATLAFYADSNWFHNNTTISNDLSLTMTYNDAAQTIRCIPKCSADLHEDTTLSTMARHFQHLSIELFSSSTRIDRFDRAFEPTLMENEENQSILLQNNSLEPNLFENTITKLHIPNIQDDFIILLDEHDKVIFTSQYTCSEIIFRIRNWEKLREFCVDNIHIDTICNGVSRYIIDTVKQLKPNYVAKFMLKLCMYRESYINDLLQQLMNLFPNQLLIENESGSRDPESDYDISLGSSDGSDADIDACVMFNNFFLTHWCLPSGIVFDTNLYPKHLNTIEPKFNVKGTGLGIFLHTPCDYPYYFFTEINDYKQNKMSVIKLRKHMTGKEWQNYIITMIKNDSDPSLKEFFRNADITYWKYMKRLLTHIREPNELITSALNEIANITPTIETSVYDTTKFEMLWTKINHKLNHLLMEHGNMLFISYLREARDIERKIRKIKDRYEDSILSAILRIPPSEMLYIDALLVSMRHKFSKAVYFANDTCVAEGSLFYTGIEQYNNHADMSFVKDKTLRTNLITNNQLYQSINEQYSGFLKDIKHYSEKQVHNGRIIYRSSKYLYRLLNTITDSGRNKWHRMGFEDNQQTKSLKIMIEELLLPIRKCKYPFDGLGSNYRARISECFALGIFATESQLETFWKYRRSTLDNSSELFKYKYNTWDIMKASHYRRKIKDLLITDLKTLAIHMRENINNNYIEVTLTMTKLLLTTDVFPNTDQCNDDNNKHIVINIENINQFDTISSIIQQNSLIINQFTSTVHNLVINCNDKIYQSHFRGMLDYVPDIVRYIFDWNISRFNIVTKYTRQDEYRRIKQSKVYDSITSDNYIKGIILGIILVCIQLFIIAPIMFLIKPIKKSVWILKTLCKIQQPCDRILLNIRAAYTTLNTGNISVVHDSRIIDTGITICDAYGTKVWTSYLIGSMRLFSIIMVEGIIWSSWMTVIISIIGSLTATVLSKHIYITRDLYIACSLCVCIIDTILNTWTTIRRHLFTNHSNYVQCLATIRENQGTRASYLSMLSYIILGILLNVIFTGLDTEHEHEQWINIIPFAKIVDTKPSQLNSIQLIMLIITQGIANTLISVIHENAAGEGRLPDFELSCRNRIDRKEWFNFPVGTFCSILKLKQRRRDLQDKHSFPI